MSPLLYPRSIIPPLHSLSNTRPYATFNKLRHKDMRHDPFSLSSSRVYVSRQVSKLQQMDNKYSIFKGVNRILDLGSAPGSWSQFAYSRLWNKAKEPLCPNPLLVSVDKEPLAPRIGQTQTYAPGIQFIQGNITEKATEEAIREKLGGDNVDLVLSDMFHHPSSLSARDEAAALPLSSAVLALTQTHLKPTGHLVLKFYPSEQSDQWAKKHLEGVFREVIRYKSSSRRPEPRESFWVCKGYKGDGVERELRGSQKNGSEKTE